MTAKTTRILHLVVTALFSLMMVGAAVMYVVSFDEVAKTFTTLGHPVHVIIPLAVAKVLGVAAIWLAPHRSIREWAYAGLFYVCTLALMAHLHVGDGEWVGALVAQVLLFTSYFTRTKKPG